MAVTCVLFAAARDPARRARQVLVSNGQQTTPLAAEVDLGSAGGAFVGVTATCRLTHNGNRYTCNGEGVVPTPTPTPTPCAVAVVSNGKGGTYTDNCNGTVTDSTSGLIWEKKTDDGGVHDKDNLYTWTTVDASPYPFDGTAKTLFLDQLNCQGAYTSGCTPWLGQNDWRLPTIVELGGQEVLGPATGGIVDFTAPACTGGLPCINAIFGPFAQTALLPYRSSSTFRFYPEYAWSVDFLDGYVFNGSKTFGYYVRAVRGGS
jgi:hypothetical protein